MVSPRKTEHEIGPYQPVESQADKGWNDGWAGHSYQSDACRHDGRWNGEHWRPESRSDGSRRPLLEAEQGAGMAGGLLPKFHPRARLLKACLSGIWILGMGVWERYGRGKAGLLALALGVSLSGGAAVLTSPALMAASLRPSGVVHGPSVYLSDVFAGLESGQDRLLGPAPAPGRSITIVGGQLIALADQYGVDWDDQSSTTSLTLTRAGHVLGRDDYAALLRKRLAEDEGAGSVVVDITSFTPLAVGESDNDPVILSDLNWDHKTGRFTANVQPSHPVGEAGADSFTLRGSIRSVQPVTVYDHALPAGHVIQQDDMRIDPAFSGTLPPLARSLPEPEKMVGMALVRTVGAGQPVLGTDLRRAILVHHGDPVLLSYNSTGIRLTATGRALEDGGSGQFVHALNLGSRMILIGRVNASGEIRIDASSTAIPPDSEEARRLGISTMLLDGGSRP